MLNLLTGLNNVQLWSQELAADTVVTSGMFVSIIEGKAALPGATGKAPYYLVFGNSNVPSVEGSGAISLIYGLCRIETDKFVPSTLDDPLDYSAGTPLTVNAAGLLTPAAAGDFVVGTVEAEMTTGLRVALNPAPSFED